MSQPTANPTPKTRFQEIKGAIDAHHTLIESESFKRGCDTAMLEYQRKLSANLGLATQHQAEALANGYRIQGANEFLAELRNLAEASAKTQPPGLARTLAHDAN
jgi:hypothetical protein